MKNLLPILFASAVALSGLTACNQAPPKAAAPQGLAAFQAPALPAPDRTDPEAVAMRQRYVDRQVAQVKAANAIAQKQMEQFYSQGQAPKGSYGKMAEGLPPVKAG